MRKKPIEVEACQHRGGNFEELINFCGLPYCIVGSKHDVEIYDKLHGKWLPLRVGEWVIKGVQGELYPCTPTVFERTYDILSD